MSRPASSDVKVSPFRFFSKKEWTQAAKQELEGAGPVEILNRRIDEVDIFPYYDLSDLPLADFQLPLSQNEFLGPRSWFNLPRIPVNNPKEANAQALLSLNSGADGILFDLQGPADPNVLFEKIEMPYCGTVFLAAGGHEDFFYKLVALAKARKYSASSLAGAIFWKGPPLKPLETIEQFKSWSQFHPLGIIADELTSPTSEIAGLLAKAVKQLDDFTGKKVQINQGLHSVAFSIFIGVDFFLEIAKLKALRFLWLQVAKAYDPHYSAPVFVHATIKAWENQAYQPHGNMIRGTMAAMSAILGGCDSLTVQPADQLSGMMTRVARNVSTILREESHLGKVSDPTAGSYYVDKLTDQLAAGAWEKFQRLVK